MKSKNKNAQLGKIITLPFVLILIIFIMVIFLFLSTSASLIKSKSDLVTRPHLVLPENDFLLRTITIPLDKNEKEMLVYDALYLALAEKISTNIFVGTNIVYERLKTLINKRNDCYYIFNSKTNKGQAHRLVNDSLVEITSEEYLYTETLTTYIAVNGEKIEIRHYYGRCPDE